MPGSGGGSFVQKLLRSKVLVPTSVPMSAAAFLSMRLARISAIAVEERVRIVSKPGRGSLGPPHTAWLKNRLLQTATPLAVPVIVTHHF